MLKRFFNFLKSLFGGGDQALPDASTASVDTPPAPEDLPPITLDEPTPEGNAESEANDTADVTGDEDPTHAQALPDSETDQDSPEEIERRRKDNEARASEGCRTGNQEGAS